MTGFTQSFYWEKIKIIPSEKNSFLKNFNENKYQVFSLDLDKLKAQLDGVPSRNNISSSSMAEIYFPDNNGGMERFQVSETSTLAPEIALKYPNIKTYIGFSLDNPGTRIRFSITPQGLKTMSTYPNKPTLFTVPLNKGNVSQYITYDRNVRIDSKEDFECLTENEYVPIKEITSFNRDANDQILRTLRIAISTTGEYTNFWDDGDNTNGDAQEDALAAVVSTLNRTNEVFEVDMAVSFQLVSGTEIIYPTASTDPYSSSSPNGQLQSTLTSEVGESNYDIGHLFDYGSNNGNAGCIGCVCVDGQKGSGFSSHQFTDNDGGPYMDDFFDIDYVPHEIGHQMGGNHTFSMSSEGTGVNYEPGSGTTIMGYAGITGADDVQDHSDPYFHYGTINQVLNNLENKTCWTSTVITNNPPVANAGSDYTIPQGTAFKLVGSATDLDERDVLTYSWEQVDDGITTRSTFGPTKTSGAVWRSRPPSTNPTRYMPVKSRVLSGELTETNPGVTVDNISWETVSTVARSLDFALTVRDRSETNGTGQFPQSDFDFMTVTVDGNSGPFAVISQTANETWNVGESQTVTWDVAGTASGIVNTPTVNIYLSTDGGLTFPFLAANNVANDGSHTFSVPPTNGDSNQLRIMVEGNDNIFYAVNSTNLSLQQSEFVITIEEPSVAVCSPNDVIYNFTYNTFQGFTGTTSFSTLGLPSGLNATFSSNTASTDGEDIELVISNIGSINEGTYDFQIIGTSGAIVKNADANFSVFSTLSEIPNLTTPSDSGGGVGLSPTFSWDVISNASSYDIEIASDSEFSSIVASENSTTNSYTGATLNQSTTYYWRVKAKNTCGDGDFSPTSSFTTQNCTVCISTGNSDWETSTTRVVFNTIDNSSGKSGGYSDYTDISTSVKADEVHELTIQVNTDGNYTVNTLVWIDWNQDCDFDDENEEYDLGTALDVEDETTTLSPLSVTIPSDALLGSTTMRVSTKYLTDPTSCMTDEDAEVEDYTIEVIDATASLDNDTFEGFNLYPNPSNGNFNLQFNAESTESVEIQLYDLTGRLVKELQFSNISLRFSESISFQNTAKGFYVLKIKNGAKQTSRKLVIE